MNKKLLTIFLSLFLVGILSVSCSNADKTGAGDTTTPKTINTKYAGIWSSSDNPDAVEIDINGNIYEYNSTRGNKGEVLESTDPSYKVKIYGSEITITFKDVNNATVNINGQNVTYTKTPQSIEQFNGKTYASEKSFNVPELGARYLWASVKDSKFAMNINDNNTYAPGFSLDSYFTVTGYGTDYTFSTPDPQGTPDQVQGTLKFAPDGSSVTMRFTKNTVMPSIVGQDIVCNIKQ
ncbi:hypothetical protein Bint_0530 [Brachyspira intermedia PWS/A]|uniref:Lipoprotein n=1 Tax=Brachyspira intermedia (strain ATCC 51140 / PWS/A) TaxID=1045858 RepID=G0EJG2_BRAIP|nr:hypothetical protein [Brachyspira intermedia]AEM21161.1 hypothetical protein Bint_0530 [Brachyspira intermedia PWS/A]